jgi:hypothetical protein
MSSEPVNPEVGAEGKGAQLRNAGSYCNKNAYMTSTIS